MVKKSLSWEGTQCGRALGRLALSWEGTQSGGHSVAWALEGRALSRSIDITIPYRGNSYIVSAYRGNKAMTVPEVCST